VTVLRGASRRVWHDVLAVGMAPHQTAYAATGVAGAATASFSPRGQCREIDQCHCTQRACQAVGAGAPNR